MIAVIDYGQDVTRLIGFLEQGNYRFEIAKDPEPILRAERVILYGDGSFPEAMYYLEKEGFVQVLREKVRKGIPLLGINLGMHLLFQSSEVEGYYQGLNLLPGHVVPFSQPADEWHWLSFKSFHPLLYRLREGEARFSRLIVLQDANAEDVIAGAEVHGEYLPAIVARHDLVGMQFDPTLSGPIGQELLYRFLTWKQKNGSEE